VVVVAEKQNWNDASTPSLLEATTSTVDSQPFADSDVVSFRAPIRESLTFLLGTLDLKKAIK